MAAASRRGLAYAAIAGAVVAADQLTKAFVRRSMELHERIPVIDGVLWVTRVHNTGAAFGVMRDRLWLLIAMSFVALGVTAYLAVCIRPRDPWMRSGLALVAGGAVGNLIDRALFGGVTDFIDLGWFPVFNIADIALDVGVAIIVAVLLFGKDRALEGSGGARCGRTTKSAHRRVDDARSSKKEEVPSVGARATDA